MEVDNHGEQDNRPHSSKRIYKLKNGKKQVKYNQLLQFPFNAIGTITSLQTIQDKMSVPSMKISTGFLIQSNLLLTSSSNFIQYDAHSGRFKKFIPIYFSTFQFGSKNQDNLVQRQIKIKAIKMNEKFVDVFKKINTMEQNQYGSRLEVDAQQIIKLKSEAIEQDFCMLKLQESVSRSYYFKWFPNLRQNTLLTVAGCENIKNSFSMFTSYNICNSINRGIISYDIDNWESGAPVYISVGEFSKKLVGIHNKRQEGQKQFNCATIITKQVIETLIDWVRSIQIQQNSRPIDKFIEKGDLFRNQGQWEKAIQYYKKSLITTQQRIGRKSIQFGKTLGKIGLMYQYNGKFQQALRYYSEELSVYENKRRYQSLQKANSFNNIGILYCRQRKFKEGIKYCKLATDIYNKLGTSSIYCPYTLQSIGINYSFQKKWQLAFESYSRALAIYQSNGKNCIQQADTFYNIGNLFNDFNYLDQARKNYQKATIIYEQIGKQTIQRILSLYNIGVGYQNQKKNKEALDWYEEAMNIDKIIGMESIEWANNINNIGNVYYNQAQLDKALHYYSKAMNIYKKLNNQSVEYADLLNNIGNVYQKKSSNKQAIKYYNESLSIYQRQESAGCAQIFNNIAIIYVKENNFDEALDYFKKALLIFAKFNNKSVQCSNIFKNIGNVYLQLGQKQKGDIFLTKSSQMK